MSDQYLQQNFIWMGLLEWAKTLELFSENRIEQIPDTDPIRYSLPEYTEQKRASSGLRFNKNI
jgi:hypothetical protein